MLARTGTDIVLPATEPTVRLIFDGRPLSYPVRQLGIGQYTAGLLAATAGRIAPA